MSTEELVRETVEYYKDHERGVKRDANGKNIGCHYVTENLNVCAVGRCFNDQGIQELGDHSGSVDEAQGDVENDEHESYSLGSFYDYLKPEYADVSMNTFEKLQIFHDNEDFWQKYKSRKGYYLTAEGKKHVKNQFSVSI